MPAPNNYFPTAKECQDMANTEDIAILSNIKQDILNAANMGLFRIVIRDKPNRRVMTLLKKNGFTVKFYEPQPGCDYYVVRWG
jgi:hypothetical protein